MRNHKIGQKSKLLSAIVFTCCLVFWGISQTNASGFGGGVVVGTGSNPAFAIGGGVAAATTTTLQTAPSDGILMISDVVLTSDPHGNCTNVVSLQTSSGSILGEFYLGAQRQNNGGGYSTYTASPSQVQHTFAFGLPVPAGETLQLHTSTSCSVRYTIAGYTSVL